MNLLTQIVFIHLWAYLLILPDIVLGVVEGERLKGNSTFIEKRYIKTIGAVSIDRARGRLPPKGSILQCVLKCALSYGCSCVRISVSSNTCEHFSAKKGDPNSLEVDLSKNEFLYYTVEGYNKTVGKENLALGKKFSQSSTYNQFKAEKAADGDPKTESRTASGRPTKGSSKTNKYPWIQIDLRAEYVITGISLMSKYPEFLHDFEVRVGNRLIAKEERASVFRLNALCFKYNGMEYLENGETRLGLCEPCPIQGRYMSIQIVNFCNNCSMPAYNMLTINEAQVWGYLPNQLDRIKSVK